MSNPYKEEDQEMSDTIASMYTVSCNVRNHPKADLVAALLNEGGERHDDVQLAFMVDGETIYTRIRGDYLVVPLEDE